MKKKMGTWKITVLVPAVASIFLITTLQVQVVAQTKPAKMVNDNSEIFTVTDEAGSFVGGIDSLYAFLGRNIKYPDAARRNNVQGKVFVQLVVEKDGTISTIEIVKGVSPELDMESLRVMKKSPRWIPAKNGGSVVRSRFVLPIFFKLS